MGDGSVKAAGTTDAGIPVAAFLPAKKLTEADKTPPPLEITSSMSVNDILVATNDLKSASTLVESSASSGLGNLGDVPGRVAKGEITQGQGQALVLGTFIIQKMDAVLKADKSPGVGSGDGFIMMSPTVASQIILDDFQKKLAVVTNAAPPVTKDKLEDLAKAALRLKDKMNLPPLSMMDPSQKKALSATIEAFLKTVSTVNTGSDGIGSPDGSMADDQFNGEVVTAQFTTIENLLVVAIPLENRTIKELLNDPAYLGDPNNRKDFETMLAIVSPGATLHKDAAGAWQVCKPDGTAMGDGDLVWMKSQITDMAKIKFNDFRAKMALNGQSLPPDMQDRFGKFENWITTYKADPSSVKLSDASQFITRTIFHGAKTVEEVNQSIDLLDRLTKGKVNYNDANPEQKAKIDKLVAAGKAKIEADGKVTLILTASEAAELDQVVKVLKDPSNPQREALLGSILASMHADAMLADADAASRRMAAKTAEPNPVDEGGGPSKPSIMPTSAYAASADDDFETAKKQAAQTFQSALLKQQQENQQTLYAIRQRLDDQKQEAFLHGLKGKNA